MFELWFYNTFVNIAYEINNPNRIVVVLPVVNITQLYNFREMRGALGLKAKTIWKKFGTCKPILDGKHLKERKALIDSYNKALREVSKAYGFYFAEKLVDYKFQPSLQIH
mgnify:CR=1 FL=1